VDLGGRDLQSLAEVEFIKRLHARQVRVPSPPSNGVALAFIQFRGEQCFQIAR